MKNRSSAAKLTANLLASPLSLKTSHLSHDCPSKSSFDFSLKGFKTFASKKNTVTVATASVLIQPRTARSPSKKVPTTISDLKDLISSRSDSVKRHLDLSHSEILKEFKASQFHLSKRFKVNKDPMSNEMQRMCQQLEYLQAELLCAHGGVTFSDEVQVLKEKIAWLEATNAIFDA